MDNLMNINNTLLADDDNDDVALYEKPLHITVSTPDLDYKGILNKVCQYINVHDIMDKIQKGAEYVVEIPAEFQ